MLHALASLTELSDSGHSVLTSRVHPSFWFRCPHVSWCVKMYAVKVMMSVSMGYMDQCFMQVSLRPLLQSLRYLSLGLG